MKNRTIKWHYLLALISMCGMSLNSEAETIVVVRGTNFQTEHLKLQKKIPQIAELDLGGDIKTITVQGAGKYRVYQQTETSITISNDGPHYDLINWRHGYSNIDELTGKNNEFNFIEQTNIKFPKVSLPTFVEEVRKLEGDFIAGQAKKCKAFNKYPCRIAPSRYIFIIKQEIKKEWVDLGLVIIMPAMGC